MGKLDLFAKAIFKEECPGLTGGSLDWELPPEIALQELRADGLFHIRNGSKLKTLPPPWSLADHDEILIDFTLANMPATDSGGDHVHKRRAKRSRWTSSRPSRARIACGLKPLRN